MRPWFHELRQRNPWLDPVLKIVITLVGILLVVIGLLMVPLPGPGWLVVFAGLALLATEFVWARRLTRHGQVVAHDLHKRVTGRRIRWAPKLKKRLGRGTSSPAF